jgi:hypothetical protein
MNKAGRSVINGLVALTAGNGTAILVNPEQVTSLRAASPGQQKHFTHTVRCMINLTDGKFVTVIETCDAVRALLGKARPP